MPPGAPHERSGGRATSSSGPPVPDPAALLATTSRLAPRPQDYRHFVTSAGRCRGATPDGRGDPLHERQTARDYRTLVRLIRARAAAWCSTLYRETVPADRDVRQERRSTSTSTSAPHPLLTITASFGISARRRSRFERRYLRRPGGRRWPGCSLRSCQPPVPRRMTTHQRPRAGRSADGGGVGPPVVHQLSDHESSPQFLSLPRCRGRREADGHHAGRAVLHTATRSRRKRGPRVPAHVVWSRSVDADLPGVRPFVGEDCDPRA